MTEYKYKISVIVKIIGEDLNKNIIQSIIKQSINFEQNVQIILTGLINSKIYEYINLYPNNIFYVNNIDISEIDNINACLDFCSGRYVTFANINDAYSLTTLNSVYNFFEKNDNLDVVLVPKYNIKTKKINFKYENFGMKNCLINLSKEKNKLILSSKATFYNANAIKENKFNSLLNYYNEADLNVRLFDKNDLYGYVCESAKYLYNENNNQIVPPSSYIELGNYLDQLNINKCYIKEFILNEILKKYRKINKETFDSSEIYDYITKIYIGIINKIDKDYILEYIKEDNILDRKLFLLKITNNNVNMNIDNSGNIIFEENIIGNIEKINIKIKRIEIDDNYLYLDIMYNNYNINNIDVIIKDEKENIYDEYYNKSIKSSYDLRYGEYILNEENVKKYKILLSKKEILIKIKNNDSFEIGASNITMLSFLKFSLFDKKIKMFSNNISLSFYENKFVMKNEKYYNNSYKIKTFLNIIIKNKYIPFLRLLSMKKKRYILINDRPEKAGDNGEALFKYICLNNKKLSKKTYFVLAKKNDEYKRLKKYGKIVIQNSLKHKFLFINSKIITSSHAAKKFYLPFDIKMLIYYIDLCDYKFVWLQHGVTHNNVARSVNKYNANIDYFVTASNREKEEIESERYFYEKDKIVLTGFPRFDYLTSKQSSIISLVPTWRRTLSGEIKECGFHKIKGDFENSEYYREYSKFLGSERLTKILEKYDYILNFNIHPGMVGYENLFKKFENKNIKIISAYNVNYSQIFSQSALMITDYSSVAFDFSYLKKPLIYFQFDKEDFYKHQYQKGYFDYTDDGFGDVIEDCDKLLEKIEFYFENDFNLEQKYINRINDTFAHTDKNNCQRIIKLIDEIINNEI